MSRFASFGTPQQIADEVRERFGVELKRQSVAHYDPEHNPGLAEKWRTLFAAAREEFIQETARIGIAHQSFRLQELDRIYRAAGKNSVVALQALEQAAKEVGGMFTNERKLAGRITIEDLLLGASGEEAAP